MCSEMDERKLDIPNSAGNINGAKVVDVICHDGDCPPSIDEMDAGMVDNVSVSDSDDNPNAAIGDESHNGESENEGAGGVSPGDLVEPENEEASDRESADKAKLPPSSRKKRAGMLAAVACLALLAIICTSQALSFLVREYPAKGSIKFDGVDIELILTTHDANGDEVVAQDGEEIPTGEVHVDRSVYAKNTGPQPVWVRVKLGFAMDTQNGEQDISDLCAFTGGSSSWIKEGEWFYLDAPLGPGEVSPALITALTVDSLAAQDRHGSGGYALTARAGAVQSKHNATTVLEVEGWPE